MRGVETRTIDVEKNRFLVVGRSPIELDKVLSASFYLHLTKEGVALKGDAVAVSSRRALTALHGSGSIGDPVQLFDATGRPRHGTVIFSQFEELKCDVSLIELDAREPCFETYIPPAQHEVKLEQEIRIIGLLPSLLDPDSKYTRISRVAAVFGIEEGSTLFRTQYYSEDGLSGAGIITTLDEGHLRLVGVHVASHDATERPPAIKKVKKSRAADADSVSDSSPSLAGSVHGHTAYQLVCEIARVDGLKTFLSVA
jgi:hypothetical protein